MLAVVHQALHAPNTSRGELESNRLELASGRTHCLWGGAGATSGGAPLVTAQRKGPDSRALLSSGGRI